MEKKNQDKAKLDVLKKMGTLNPNPGKVKDRLFLEDEFFDPHDLVQVKYEMLRRVQKDESSITEAASVFGFSRLSVYRIQSTFEEHGLAGLVSQRRGPKDAHKLSKKVMEFIEQEMKKDKTLRSQALQQLVEEHFHIRIHPRSIERALVRGKKRGEFNAQ